MYMYINHTTNINIFFTHRQKLLSSHFLKFPLSTALISGIIHSNTSEKILTGYEKHKRSFQVSSYAKTIYREELSSIHLIHATIIVLSFANWNVFKLNLKRWAHIAYCIRLIDVGDIIARKKPKAKTGVKNVKELSTRVERKILIQIG